MNAKASFAIAALALTVLTGRARGHHDNPPAQASPDTTRRVVALAVVDTVETVEVVDRFDQRIRRYQTSSQGTVTAAEIRSRPIGRPGEILEAVPGVVISQHSGEGKANQYYLRGFNLDHGTDLATFVAGTPVNMPTHAHGQGYTDLNFLIPELVTGVEYKKGTYFADEGDFATAGAAHIAYGNTLPSPVAYVGAGQDGHRRALLAGSRATAGGVLLGALELFHEDGPWVNPDDYRKVNALLRWGRTGTDRAFRVTAMAYGGRWNSTDQIPQRAVDAGAIDRLGTVDPSDGGNSHRYSLSAEWQRFTPTSLFQAMAYVMDYEMSLFSNFTYFLDDTARGDQFEQADDRIVTGARLSQTWRSGAEARPVEITAGLQARRDDIATVGLYHTQAQNRLSTTREDQVAQTSVSPYVQAALPLGTRMRATVALRSDTYWFHVASDLPENAGDEVHSILSPKLGLQWRASDRTALFLNGGTGFHSNDARGATITVDPVTGHPADRVAPLARAAGAEVGVRTAAVPGLQLATTLWALDIESELVFIGDAGATEASRPSRRAGVECTAAYALGSHVMLDAGVAASRAWFRDDEQAGNYVPGAVGLVFSAGATLDDGTAWFGSLRSRTFGPRPLIEDNSVRSRGSTVLSAELGRRVGALRLQLEGYNLLNSRGSDVEYFYTSRLPGEAEGGVDDIHTHPEPPRWFRLRLTAGAPASLPHGHGHPHAH